MKRRILIGTSLAFLIQILLLGGMIANRASMLRAGETLILHVQPVDPRHFLLGSYIRMQLPIGTFTPSKVSDFTFRSGQIAYALLEKDVNAEKESWRVRSLHHVKPSASPENPVLRSRVLYLDPSEGYGLSYGVENYYLPQKDAMEIEKTLEKGGLAIELAVLPSSGRVAIRRLLVDGQPKYQDPLF